MQVTKKVSLVSNNMSQFCCSYLKVISLIQNTSHSQLSNTMEFFPNVFPEFAEFSDKIFVIKRARTCHLLCKRPKCYRRHMWGTWSLNWTQFMLQWLIRFPEFNESPTPFRKNSNDVAFNIPLLDANNHWKHFVLIRKYFFCISSYSTFHLHPVFFIINSSESSEVQMSPDQIDDEKPKYTFHLLNRKYRIMTSVGNLINRSARSQD